MSVLQTIDLKKYYGTKPNITRVLDGVNYSVEDGEFVALKSAKAACIFFQTVSRKACWQIIWFAGILRQFWHSFL